MWKLWGAVMDDFNATLQLLAEALAATKQTNELTTQLLGGN